MTNSLPPFIPGLELSRRYYREAVRPLLAAALPGLPHSACLIGYGSDVLGCDTPMSRDHMWGPRLVLLLPEPDFDARRAQVDQVLREGLPRSFLGYPTSFSPPDAEGVRLLRESAEGPVEHLIQIDTLTGYFDRELGRGRWQNPGPAEWLTFSEQRLLSLTAGGVFHDDLGLADARARLAYYPREVWLYLMACQWSLIGQEEPFVGRTGDVGDDLGSRILTARLAQACMRLAYMQAKRYAPYSKWFGTLFLSLPAASELFPHLAAALAGVDWHTRQRHLCAAYSCLARAHNALGLTEPVPVECSPFHNRPFDVIHADQIAARLKAALKDPYLRRQGLYGSPNQFSDAADLLEDTAALGRLRGLYEVGEE